MFPYRIERVEEDVERELLTHFEGERTGFVRVDGKWILPEAYGRHALQYYTAPIREDDVWVITYPRSGTTVCQELVWLVNNGFDFDKSSRIPLEFRFPFYEFSLLHHPEFHSEVLSKNGGKPEVREKLASWRVPGYLAASRAEAGSPRHLKSHLPFSLLPEELVSKAKSVYVARNPKDVAVSYYHHNRLLKVHGYNGDFPRYWSYFQRDLLVFSPYWDHVLEGWERRNEKNVLFLFYEDLVKDPCAVIRRIADFLGKEAKDEDVRALKEHLEIDNFRKRVPIMEDIPIEGMVRPKEQGFIRRGKVGGNEEFTEDLMAKADAWIEEHLSKTDLRFPEV